MHQTIGRFRGAWLISLAIAACSGADDDQGADPGLAEPCVTPTSSADDGVQSTSGATTGASESAGDATSSGGAEATTDGTGEDATSWGTTGFDSTTGAGDTGPGTGEDGDTTGELDDSEGTSGTGDSEGTTGDSEGTTGDSEGTSGTTGEAAVGFAEAIWPIFDERCGCHTDSNGAGKLKLAEDVAYDNLVGQPSNQLPEMLLVDPGSSATSYLWHKLNDTHKSVDGKGKVMPPGGKLKMDKLDLIQMWIDQGAAP